MISTVTKGIKTSIITSKTIKIIVKTISPNKRNVTGKMWKNIKNLGYAGGYMLINNCQNRGAAEQVREILLKEFPNANIKIGTTKGLCSFYAEKGGLMIGFETAK